MIGFAAVRRGPGGAREVAAMALQVGEHAIAALGPDNVQRVLEFLIIVHDRP